MTDSPELAAIRARDAERSWAVNEACEDRRALLRMLDELRAGTDGYRETMLIACKERDAALAEKNFMREALEPMRHLRVEVDGLSSDIFSSAVLTDLIDAQRCVIAYIRNDELSDRLNQYFERVRAALSADNERLRMELDRMRASK